MKKPNIFSFVLVLSIFSVAMVSGMAYAERELEKHEYVAGQVIVKLKEGSVLGQNFLKGNKLRSSKKVSKRIAAYVAEIEGAEDPIEVARKLRKNPNVEYAEPNYIIRGAAIPNDPLFSQQWGMQAVAAPSAWDITHDSTLPIGVIDSGIDYNHDDLATNIWINPNEVGGNGLDDDGNGFIDDVRGWDFANNDNDPMDDNGHGTHVAGVIAAKGDNGIGVAGVNWNAKLVAIKFLDANSIGTVENAVRAIEYANTLGLKLNNTSWQLGGFSQLLRDAFANGNANGRLFVAAAGNNATSTDVTPFYPAAFDLPNIISVAASNQSNGLASFSNYGPNTVDLAAPGEGIASTYIGNSYVIGSGTSAAAPHVTGAAALLWENNPSLTHLQLKDKILNYSQLSDPLIPITVSGGILNIYNFFDPDSVAPTGVGDLVISGVTRNSATLTWTASGDDSVSGQASRYDIRYSTQPINDVNFSQATQATREPKPKPSGLGESFIVQGLQSNTTYYFALKVLDNVNNTSAISNVVSDTTLSPSIVFFDNMETGTANWTVEGDLWHQSSRRYQSPTTSWYYGRESTGNYDNGQANQGKLVSVPVSLTNLVNSELTFKHFLETEDFHAFDNAKVEVSNNGGASWTTLMTKITTNGAWANESINLSAYDGQTIRIRFYFNTVDDSFNFFEGWYVDDVTLKGTPVVLPPVANVGGPYSGNEDIAILFDGSGSSDPNGLSLIYKWDFGDGSLLETTANATTTHVYVDPGNYTVTLVVNNGTHDSAASLTLVTVNDVVENAPPVANVGGPYNGFEDRPIIFDGSGSFDAENLPLTYRWDFGDGSAIVTTTSATTTHAYANPGNYTITLVVNDGVFDSPLSTAQVVVVDEIKARAFYTKDGKRNLKVLATSSSNGVAVLTVEGYGQMTYRPRLRVYTLLADSNTQPQNVTIISSLGGSATVPVKLLSRRDRDWEDGWNWD